MSGPASSNGKSKMCREAPACDTAGLDPSPAKIAAEVDLDLGGDDVDFVARLTDVSAVPTDRAGDSAVEAVGSLDPIVKAGTTNCLGGRSFPPASAYSAKLSAVW